MLPADLCLQLRVRKRPGTEYFYFAPFQPKINRAGIRKKFIAVGHDAAVVVGKIFFPIAGHLPPGASHPAGAPLGLLHAPPPPPAGTTCFVPPLPGLP